ncbi:ABC transporter substrate-binding protein [Anaerococcus sp. AGMB09787]|uniref:ABC transporter substrate-binding protein n=1 Tax=Anaerococcus sp. AGMB09787 TaxID=2922869 RepID=UPI001FAEE511|nr:ABC transporter substrate-binding protein [Anaerococcus sp. AGMB09787]
MKKNLNKLFLLLAVVFIITSCSSTTNKESEDAQGSIEIEDILGRKISLDKPLENIIVQGSGSGGPLMTMLYLDKDNFHTKLAAMDDGLKINRNDLYTRLVEKIPELEKIKRVADFADNDFSVEDILSIGADGIIAPVSYKAQLDSIEDKIDIPIIYINYHNQDFDDHIKSTEIIAKATGLDKNLEKLISFYKEKTDLVRNTIKDKEDKPSVYIELGYSGELAYDNSYGNEKMWGKMVNDAGGYNIAGDVLGDEEASPVAEEFVLSKDPDIIVITGSSWLDREDSLHMGFDVSDNEIRDKLSKYMTRTGWDKLSAIQNKKIYALCHNMARDMSDFYSYERLAKIFDPEAFKDLDPEADLKEFYDLFMPIELEGTWFASYE